MKRFLENLSPEDRRTHRKWTVSVIAIYAAAIIVALVVASTLPPTDHTQREAANFRKGTEAGSAPNPVRWQTHEILAQAAQRCGSTAMSCHDLFARRDYNCPIPSSVVLGLRSL